MSLASPALAGGLFTTSTFWWIKPLVKSFSWLVSLCFGKKKKKTLSIFSKVYFPLFLPQPRGQSLALYFQKLVGFPEVKSMKGWRFLSKCDPQEFPSESLLSAFRNWLQLFLAVSLFMVLSLLLHLGLPQWQIGYRICLQCRRCRRYEFDPWVRKIP